MKRPANFRGFSLPSNDGMARNPPRGLPGSAGLSPMEGEIEQHHEEDAASYKSDRSPVVFALLGIERVSCIRIEDIMAIGAFRLKRPAWRAEMGMRNAKDIDRSMRRGIRHVFKPGHNLLSAVRAESYMGLDLFLSNHVRGG